MEESNIINGLRSRIEELEVEVDLLRERVEELKLEKEELERENRELKDEIAYEAWHRDHDTDLTNLTNQVREQLTWFVKKMTNQVREQEAEIERLQELVLDLKIDKGNLESRNEELKGEIQRLNDEEIYRILRED